MTFIKSTNVQDSETNRNANLSAFAKLHAHLSSYSDYGWNLDSIAHVVLFVPFAVATIVCLSMLDWGGAFTMV